MKKILNSKTVVKLVFVTFVITTLVVAVQLIMAPAAPAATGQEVRVKSDYVLMLLQCLLGIAAMMLPGVLERKAKINIPSGMTLAFAGFLFCAIYLGEVQAFYFRVPHWDTLLHTFSGAALGAIGLSTIGLLNKSKSVAESLSPVFVAVFAFCFAVAAGTVWEIYEFAADSLVGTNMQKFVTESGEVLVGQAALADTMKDIIVDSLGALAVSLVGYISVKNEFGWLELMQLRRSRPAPAPVPQPSFALQATEPYLPQVQPAVAVAAMDIEQKLSA